MSEKLSVRFAKIVSREKLPDRILCCGSYNNEDPKKLALGRVFYFLEIVSPWFPNNHVSQAIIKTLFDSYYSQSSLDTALNLENTLKDVNNCIADLAGEGDHDWVNKLNGLIGVINDNEIHFSQTGSLNGYLIRDSRSNQITDNPSVRKKVSPLRVFEQLITGNIEKEDRFVITNSQLFNHLSVDRMKIELGADHIELGLEQIFKYLKKVKAKEVNVLAFEVNTVDGFSHNTLSNCPTEFFLDLPLDSKIIGYKRAVSPYVKKSVKGLNVFAKYVIKYLGIAGRNIKVHVFPKLSKIAKQSKDKVAEKVKSSNIAFLSKSRSKDGHQNFVKIKSASGPYFKKSLNSTKLMFRYFIPYINQLKSPANRKYIYIGLAVLILVGCYLKISANNNKQVNDKEKLEIVGALSESKSTFETAKINLGLKKTEEGKNGLYEALNLANKAKLSQVNKQEAEKLWDEISAKIDELIGAQRVNESFLLSEIGNGIYQIIYAGNSIYAISKNGNIESINTKTKETKKLAGITTGGEIKTITVSSKGDSFFLLTATNRMFNFNVQDEFIKEVEIIDSSGKWEDANSIAEFAGNIYLLESQTGIAWKHTAVDPAYSLGKDYLDTRKISIKEAVGIAIDGSIYILQKDGATKRFTKGAYDSEFSLKGIPEPDPRIDGPVKIVCAGEQSGDIYIIDKSKNRVLKFNRNGDFQKQYVTDLGSIDDISVNPKVQKIWLLIGGKIYETS